MNLSFSLPTRPTRTPAIIIGAILAAAGCSSSSAPKTGSLDVTVVAPAGVTGNVTVSGPNSYSKAVSATTTLTGLAPGSYTVTAASVATSDTIVGVLETPAVSGSPVSVAAGKAVETATVTYSPRAGSGGLWSVNFAGGVISKLSSAQLAAGTSAAATVAIATGGAGLSGIAFDASGNLWTTKFSADSIIEFPAASLTASGTPTPGVTLAAPSLTEVSGLAFDASGNLWVASRGSGKVIAYTASQLTSSGTPTPSVVISGVPGPIGIAFDANGNLWTVGVDSLVEYSASQLAASGSPTPAVSIGDDGSHSLNTPLGMAIDASGNVWVANGDNMPYSVVKFSASQLTASGAPVPAVTLTGASIVAPGSIAFDASGNLWVSNFFTAPPIVEFAASQLVSSGSPTPNIAVTSSSLSSPWGIAFNPHASALPLKP